MECYYAWNTNEETVLKSASGSIFTAIAECVLNEQEVVYGANIDQEAQKARYIIPDFGLLCIINSHDL